MKINNEDELVEKFAAKLVEDKGEILDGGKKAEEVERIVDEVDDMFIDEVIGSLPEERQRALDDLAEREEEIPEQLLSTIILGAGLDFSKITEKVFKTYRGKYLGLGEEV